LGIFLIRRRKDFLDGCPVFGPNALIPRFPLSVSPNGLQNRFTSWHPNTLLKPVKRKIAYFRTGQI
jgi:hypothetical protein